VRLGLVTERGHGERIRDTFGAKWAWLTKLLPVFPPKRGTEIMAVGVPLSSRAIL